MDIFSFIWAKLVAAHGDPANGVFSYAIAGAAIFGTGLDFINICLIKMVMAKTINIFDGVMP